MLKIKNKLENQFLWVSVNETMDSEGHYNENIIVGALNKEKSTIPYLVNMINLDVTNNIMIPQAVIDSLKLV